MTSRMFQRGFLYHHSVLMRRKTNKNKNRNMEIIIFRMFSESVLVGAAVG